MSGEINTLLIISDDVFINSRKIREYPEVFFNSLRNAGYSEIALVSDLHPVDLNNLYRGINLVDFINKMQEKGFICHVVLSPCDKFAPSSDNNESLLNAYKQLYRVACSSQGHTRDERIKALNVASSLANWEANPISQTDVVLELLTDLHKTNNRFSSEENKLSRFNSFCYIDKDMNRLKIIEDNNNLYPNFSIKTHTVDNFLQKLKKPITSCDLIKEPLPQWVNLSIALYFFLLGAALGALFVCLTIGCGAGLPVGLTLVYITLTYIQSNFVVIVGAAMLTGGIMSVMAYDMLLLLQEEGTKENSGEPSTQVGDGERKVQDTNCSL